MMKNVGKEIINDIDFGGLYRQHIKRAEREDKGPQDWDKRALTMSRTCGELNSPYVKAFISRMNLNGAQTLLDVGCGAGTICLSIAAQFKEVYALDYSQGMLDVLSQRSQSIAATNVTCMLKAWEDSWEDVPECDISVSSRSSMVHDIEDALYKINAKTKKRVYMTMTVDKNFISRDALKYIGRDSAGFPDYIYAVNILHQQGYQVRVDFISTPHMGMKPVSDGVEGFIDSVRWSVGVLSTEEIEKLTHYFYTCQNSYVPVMPTEKTWAFLSWSKV